MWLDVFFSTLSRFAVFFFSLSIDRWPLGFAPLCVALLPRLSSVSESVAASRTSSSFHRLRADSQEREIERRRRRKKKQREHRKEKHRERERVSREKKNMDFAGAAQRLRREPAAAAQRAREKADRERAEASRAAALREQAEEEKRQRRLAQLEREEEARVAREAALEASKGVSWSSEFPLVASAIDPARSAAARGIRRGALDKAMLPRGAGASLLEQNARVNGAPAFELVAVGPPPPPPPADGGGAGGGESGLEALRPPHRRTHVGVLDYGCEDGRVALPPAVAARLWPWAKGVVVASEAREARGGGEFDDGEFDGGDDDDGDEEMTEEQTTAANAAAATATATALPLALAGTGVPPGARVIATYRALPKGTFARLQPLEAGFQQAAGEHVKEILERALARYCCLTEGDEVDVEIEDVTFVLRVQALLPAEAVSVVETDLEVEVEPSEETARRLAAEERERERARERAVEAAARLLESRKAREEAAEMAAKALEAEEAARDARRRELAESLPPEPPPPSTVAASSSLSESSPAAAVVAFRLRTPDGRSASRRFDALSTRVSVLFDWADSLEGGGAGAARGSYDLVVAGGGGRALEPPPSSSVGGGGSSLASTTTAKTTTTTTTTTLAEAGFDRGGFALLVRPRAAADG